MTHNLTQSNPYPHSAVRSKQSRPWRQTGTHRLHSHRKDPTQAPVVESATVALERLGLNVDSLAETPYEKGDGVGEIGAGEFRPVAARSQRELVGYTATGERG